MLTQSVDWSVGQLKNISIDWWVISQSTDTVYQPTDDTTRMDLTEKLENFQVKELLHDCPRRKQKQEKRMLRLLWTYRRKNSKRNSNFQMPTSERIPPTARNTEKVTPREFKTHRTSRRARKHSWLLWPSSSWLSLISHLLRDLKQHM